MGSVWAAEHLTLRSKVAVKLIDPTLATSSVVVQRFEREARAAASLRSPNVVQVLDFGVDEGSPYLVMELLNGESLAERLHRCAALPPREIALVMEQIGRAVSRAHAAGFVHRDLKPDNVFLVEDGPDFFVKVLDFGIAKSIRAIPDESGTHLTQTGALIGTPHYMSPEQADGRADARSDLWSMAVIAFQCTTGHLPFSGSSLPALLRSICYDPPVMPSCVAPVPPGFDAWFLRAVARDSTQRYQTSKELLEALLPLLEVPREAWLSSVGASSREVDAPTLRLKAMPDPPVDRRGERRIPSSIPAGIDRGRDLQHAALIHNASRNGALLATRRAFEPGQRLMLTLEVAGTLEGESLMARVIRSEPRPSDLLWKYDVGVRFEAPLGDVFVLELQKRARRSGTGD